MAAVTIKMAAVCEGAITNASHLNGTHAHKYKRDKPICAIS